ncbi:glycosyltransferase [Antarcticibacterium sp. 1MA-6-2]|nr:glycosyltransferase [Antarcticibacterium sp. 1MA-6-2]UJH91749.1 glycosyltransferase [Antarcticibacterium sp. 1MA-6-2]
MWYIVVAFNTGGIPDLIEHKKNGYLANYKDAKDLAAGIQYCLSNHTRGYALPQFDEAIITNQHMDLIKSMQD